MYKKTFLHRFVQSQHNKIELVTRHVPRPVIHTVDIADRSKRHELVETALERATAWVELQDKDPHLDKSNAQLDDLCTGMEQVRITKPSIYYN